MHQYGSLLWDKNKLKRFMLILPFILSILLICTCADNGDKNWGGIYNGFRCHIASLKDICYIDKDNLSIELNLEIKNVINEMDGVIIWPEGNESLQRPFVVQFYNDGKWNFFNGVYSSSQRRLRIKRGTSVKTVLSITQPNDTKTIKPGKYKFRVEYGFTGSGFGGISNEVEIDIRNKE